MEHLSTIQKEKDIFFLNCVLLLHSHVCIVHHNNITQNIIVPGIGHHYKYDAKHWYGV